MKAYPHTLPSILKDPEHDHSSRFGSFCQTGRFEKSQCKGLAECILRADAEDQLLSQFQLCREVPVSDS